MVDNRDGLQLAHFRSSAIAWVRLPTSACRKLNFEQIPAQVTLNGNLLLPLQISQCFL